MTIDVEKLTDEQLGKLQKAINKELEKIVNEADEKAKKLLEPYGLDFRLVVSVGAKQI